MPSHPLRNIFRLLLFFGLSATLGRGVEDGIYNVTNLADYHSVLQQQVWNLRDVQLGEKYLPVPTSVTLQSQSNDNTDFKLWVRWANSPRPHELAVVVGDKVLPFTYSSGGEYGKSDFFDDALHLSDPALIAQVAALFKITPYTRQNPGHQYTCKFIPDPKGYPLVGVFPVTFQITNLGSTTFCFPRGGDSGGDDGTMADFLLGPFTFSARFYPIKPGEDSVVPNRPYDFTEGGAAVIFAIPKPDPEHEFSTLHPGDVFTTQVDMGKYLKITKQGTYEVRGSFHFQLVDPEHGKANGKKVPWLILWDEYATGQFEMKIGDNKSK